VKQTREIGSRSLKQNEKEQLLESVSPLLACNKYAEGRLLHVYYQPVNILLPLTEVPKALRSHCFIRSQVPPSRRQLVLLTPLHKEGQ